MGEVQRRQLFAGGQCAEIRHGVVGEVQPLELVHRAEGVQRRDGVAPQVQLLQVAAGGQWCQIRHLVICEI